MEWATIEIPVEKLKELSLTDYKLKAVVVRDDFFNEDEIHKKLLKVYLKAKKDLRDYEFNKRHNIR
jgi:hypothetical protein